MPVLTNPRREKYAQLLAEGKKTAEEAYELCGYKPSRFNASKLANNPSVKQRVIQLTTTAAKIVVTAHSLIDEAEAVRVGAMESRQFAAANGAIKEKGVLSGVRIERSEIGGPGEFDHMSDAELKRMMVERFVKLGLVPGLAITDGSITFNGVYVATVDDDH